MQATPLRPSFYKTVDRMRIDTGVRAFDDYANVIGRGNMISDGQISMHIRPHAHTRMPMGDPCEPGRLQTWDLDHFCNGELPAPVRRWVTQQTMQRGLWLYRFSHWKDGVEVVHGYVATRHYDGDVIAIIPEAGSGARSVDVLTWCARVLMGDGEHVLPEPMQPA